MGSSYDTATLHALVRAVHAAQYVSALSEASALRRKTEPLIHSASGGVMGVGEGMGVGLAGLW